MMRAAIVLVCCAIASASAAPWSVDVPASFREQADDNDVHAAYARGKTNTVAVDSKLYTSGSVALTRIVWQFKPALAPTRSALDQVDRDLVASDAARVTKQVSAVRAFQDEQMIVDAFDELDKTRVYHRRLYAADRSGVVHVLWTICAGPADQIVACEQAQRSMRLALSDPAPLPIGEYNDAPVTPRAPWSFVLPRGYAEVPGAQDELVTRLRDINGMVLADARVYESSARDVRLIGLTGMVFRLARPTQAYVESVTRELIAGGKRIMTKHITDSIELVDGVTVVDHVGEVQGYRLHLRHLVGVALGATWLFSIVCAGPADEIAACEAAQQSMSLDHPNAIEPLPAVATAHRRASRRWWSVLSAAAMSALVLSLGLMIYRTARRDRRRRRR